LKQFKPAKQAAFTYFIFETRQGIFAAKIIFHLQNQVCKTKPVKLIPES